MQIPVLIEQVANNGYRATSGPPLAVATEGATRDEALQKLQQQLRQRLNDGAEVAAVEVAATHPLAKHAGIFSPDDPLVQEWLDIMAESRRNADREQDAG